MKKRFMTSRKALVAIVLCCFAMCFFAATGAYISTPIWLLAIAIWYKTYKNWKIVERLENENKIRGD